MKETLPCGHEIDEEVVRMAQNLAKVKQYAVNKRFLDPEAPDVINARYTCRKDHPDGKPISWELVPRYWRRIVPRSPSGTVPNGSTPPHSYESHEREQ